MKKKEIRKYLRRADDYMEKIEKKMRYIDSTLFFISLGMEYQMETIQRLERELEVAKTERIREKSTYMSRIRESRMQHKVDSLRLGLTVQEQPPFRLRIND